MTESEEMMQPTADLPQSRGRVWAARAALVIFLLLVAAQIVSIARGGL